MCCWLRSENQEVLGLPRISYDVSRDALSGSAPELFYIKFMSKTQTLILALVLKVKSELLGFYEESTRKLWS